MIVEIDKIVVDKLNDKWRNEGVWNNKLSFKIWIVDLVLFDWN